MSDPDLIVAAVAKFRRMIDEFQARQGAATAGLLIPESNVRRAREFAQTMDDCSRQIVAAFPEFSPPEWEAFIDLLPNVRKVLGLS